MWSKRVTVGKVILGDVREGLTDEVCKMIQNDEVATLVEAV